MAILAFGQHHAGKEGAESGRQPDKLHQQGNAHDDEQGQPNEDLADAGFGDKPEEGAHQEAARQDDGGHGREDGQRLGPGWKLGDQAGAMIVMRGGRGDERQQRQNGDHRDVLKQQD